ncbi:MAG: homoserine kinase, partial [Acidobacteriota bacterium]|nr:homoserine kinase [Acidobacteriota bacterium]
LHKGMPLASGLGSSAASAVAAVTAANALLRLDRSQEDLLRCVLEAERSACGSAHGDNAAPSLYGGFVLVRGAGGANPRVDPLPVADDLFCALLHPHVAVETGAARALLGDRVPLAAAVVQWGNTAALTAGLFRDDDELLASALEDAIAEPLRAGNVPGFADLRQAALDHGALGAGLSGSGPTLFALCRGRRRARQIADAMARALEPHGVEGDTLVTPVGAPGARVLARGEEPCAT